MYNTITSTTTNYDLLGTETGYAVTIKSLDYFNTIILFLIPITIYFVVGIFKKKK